MSKRDKLLEKMRNNPLDWRITDLVIIAKQFNVSVRKNIGSHVYFGHPTWSEILTVPAHRPVKPIYIKKFIILIDFLKGEKK